MNYYQKFIDIETTIETSVFLDVNRTLYVSGGTDKLYPEPILIHSKVLSFACKSTIGILFKTEDQGVYFVFMSNLNELITMPETFDDIFNSKNKISKKSARK